MLLALFYASPLSARTVSNSYYFKSNMTFKNVNVVTVNTISFFVIGFLFT